MYAKVLSVRHTYTIEWSYHDYTALLGLDTDVMVSKYLNGFGERHSHLYTRIGSVLQYDFPEVRLDRMHFGTTLEVEKMVSWLVWPDCLPATLT